MDSLLNSICLYQLSTYFHYRFRYIIWIPPLCTMMSSDVFVINITSVFDASYITTRCNAEPLKYYYRYTLLLTIILRSLSNRERIVSGCYSVRCRTIVIIKDIGATIGEPISVIRTCVTHHNIVSVSYLVCPN